MNNYTVLKKINKLIDNRQAFALISVVRFKSPTSARPGAKAIVYKNGKIQGWIGGGCAQPAVIKTAIKSLTDGQPRFIRISPNKNDVVEQGLLDFKTTCYSGGTLDIFVDPVLPKSLLLIIGNSPCSQSLCVLASRVGFDVIVIFDKIDSSLYPDAIKVFDKLNADLLKSYDFNFVIVATQGNQDQKSLILAISIKTQHIGFISSEKKFKKIKQDLEKKSYKQEQLARILQSIGVDIGAVTAEEIALSVLAKLVSLKHQKPISDKDLINDKNESCCAKSSHNN